MTATVVQALQVAASGANLTTGAASARVAIPNTSSGQRPRLIRVLATVAAYVRVGDSTVVAAAGDFYLDAGGASAVVLNTNGASHIAGIQVSAAGLVNVTPLED